MGTELLKLTKESKENLNEARFSWNLVLHDIQLDQLTDRKLKYYVQKIGRRLIRFHPDLIHLTIDLRKHPKRPLYEASFSLRVPSNILHVNRSGQELLPVINECVNALLKELDSLKSELRRDVFWKRRHRREALKELKILGFSSEPVSADKAPQTFGAMVRALFEQHYDQLIRHVQRIVRVEEDAGVIPKGQIIPALIVDEVAALVEQEPENKPKGISWLIWFYRLVHQKLSEKKALLGKMVKEEIQIGDKESTTNVLSPEKQTSHEAQELLNAIQRYIYKWPKLDRQVFELHCVEGFEPEEIALILQKKLTTVIGAIQRINQRIREALLTESTL